VYGCELGACCAPNKHDRGDLTPAGGRDTISSVEDVALLKQRLQPGILQLHHHQPDYAHLDFELVRYQR